MYPKKELPFFIVFTAGLCSITAMLALLTHSYPESMGSLAKQVGFGIIYSQNSDCMSSQGMTCLFSSCLTYKTQKRICQNSFLIPYSDWLLIFDRDCHTCLTLWLSCWIELNLCFRRLFSNKFRDCNFKSAILTKSVFDSLIKLNIMSTKQYL